MNSLRLWATPLTIGAFFLVSVTGVLMFFHWDTGLNKTAHEWLGWAFVAGGLAHLTLHFASFKKHLQKPVSASIIAIFLVLLGLSFISLSQQEMGAGGTMRMIADKLADAPLAQVAAVTGQMPDALVATLQNAGVHVQNPATESIATLAGNDRSQRMKLLRVLFAQ
jgi:hypothetical protein